MTGDGRGCRVGLNRVSGLGLTGRDTDISPLFGSRRPVGSGSSGHLRVQTSMKLSQHPLLFPRSLISSYQPLRATRGIALLPSKGPRPHLNRTETQHRVSGHMEPIPRTAVPDFLSLRTNSFPAGEAPQTPPGKTLTRTWGGAKARDTEGDRDRAWARHGTTGDGPGAKPANAHKEQLAQDAGASECPRPGEQP